MALNSLAQVAKGYQTLFLENFRLALSLVAVNELFNFFDIFRSFWILDREKFYELIGRILELFEWAT